MDCIQWQPAVHHSHLTEIKPLSTLVIVVWSSLCLIWGSTWIVIKIGLNDLPPIGFAAVRFMLATVVLFAILRIQKIPLPNNAKNWRLLALTGLLQFSVNYSLIFWAEQHITSGLAAVLQATISIFGLLLAWVYLPNEQITKAKIIAVCLGVAGVAVIFSDQLRLQNMMAFYGSVGVVIAAYAATHSAILVKARGSGLHPTTMLFGQIVCGLPPMIAYSLIVEGNPLHYHWTWLAVVAVLYLAIVGTVLAFWLFYWLLKRVESTLAMMVSVVTPVIAVVIGWLVLNERMPPQILLGGSLIVASICLIVFGRARNKSSS
jgi:drug/metabolite transporter (DMT)-like permease